MISFVLNGKPVGYTGDPERTLLQWLRNDMSLTALKDGCSAQAFCGACLVEIDGEARLSCVTRMKQLEQREVVTPEGIPGPVREILAAAFAEKGAVQCGFCTPGLIMRTRLLFERGTRPTREEIIKAIRPHYCRCTGYVKIVDAIILSLEHMKSGTMPDNACNIAAVGTSFPKYQAMETALGDRKFVDDLNFEGMLHGVLLFCEHPRARIKNIHTENAAALDGVKRILTAADIPGDPFTGLVVRDWPLMLKPGDVSRYIGDVICCVVARDEDTARRAAALVRVEYDVLKPVCDPIEALKPDAPPVHADRPNLLADCHVKRGGDIGAALGSSAFTVSSSFTTQRIEHAFMETEAAVAMPENDGIHLWSQGQGIYVDRRQVASLLGLDSEKVRVSLLPCGGGFGGKEDLTVQGHAALAAWVCHVPVKVKLSREESIRMHPKRHPVFMNMELGCDASGMLTALYLRAWGDTGAYASVGTKVMERVAGHAAGGYHIPVVDIESKTVYTNNIPSGAMRGFGVNQVVFALESCIDRLCRQGGFNRWQFRYNNALDEGRMTATGQVLGKGVGLRKTLIALKPQFDSARYAGLACGIKNCGIGNGMTDFSHVLIRVCKGSRLHVSHGWTDMGQGISNVVIQIIGSETGIDGRQVDVETDTGAGLETGMTTSSRATVLLGNAVLDAVRKLKKDLEQFSLEALEGTTYRGYSECDWTTKPGDNSRPVVTHFSYGYASQLVILSEEGKIVKVVAAHDAGKIMNRTLFEGQIEGGVVMGLGYALSEDLPMENGKLISGSMSRLGLLRAADVPEIEVIGIEDEDPFGPYGAKGIGEIGLVPTAAAVANALYSFDGRERNHLPLKYNG